MGIVLSGATLVTAAACCRADLRIEGERIAAVGEQVGRPGDRVISCQGCYLFPGGVDPHTHFDLPAGETVTADDFAGGTQAALIGGTTTIIDYATQFKGETLPQAAANWHAKADGRSFTDYGFHLAITDWNDQTSREMEQMIDREGISSFKFYLAYRGSLQVDDGTFLQALRRSGECGGLACVHCENGDIVAALIAEELKRGETAPCFHPLSRPPAVEEEATMRAIAIARMAGAPLYIVHLTCRGALAAVIKAKARGEKVYGETCPQYLLLDESLYRLDGFEGAKYVISPPLRSEEDRLALWQGLAGGLIDTIATDHCSFNFQGQKSLGRNDFSKIPNGIPGVEHRLSLLYSYGVVPGRITLNRFVELTAARPAQLFGLYPRKGTIAPGSDADLVVWDPRSTSTISAAGQHQRVDYTPFEGYQVRGSIRSVYLRGREVVRGGELIGSDPGGEYLFRRPFPERGGRCIQ